MQNFKIISHFTKAILDFAKTDIYLKEQLFFSGYHFFLIFGKDSEWEILVLYRYIGGKNPGDM